MNSRIKFLVVMGSTCMVLLLLLGTLLGKSSNPNGAYPHIGVYTEVLSRIKSEYVEEPDIKSVTLGALNGMLESIDPFASYLNAEQYKEYLKTKGSANAGVGLVLAKKFGYVGVVGVVPGSPAAKAGIGPQDMIETINSIGTRDMPLAYANMLLEGEAGTAVDLTVIRVRRPEPQKLTLTRAVVADPPVSARLMPDQVGYIRPETLAAGKVKEVAAAVTRLQNQGASKFVLDLRNTAVGTPEEGIALANLFMDKGLITYLQGQRMPRKDFEADPTKGISKAPLSVITNRGTADGAEIAAAALLDSKRAKVVGERSYGDASVRRAVTLDDGGAIILSVAKYYAPSGKAIQDSGVTPEVIVNEPEGQVELDENGDPLPEAPEAPVKPEDDPLLKKAVEVLGAAKAASAARP